MNADNKARAKFNDKNSNQDIPRQRSKLLVLTHNYPRFEGDHYGKFVFDLFSEMTDMDINIVVPWDKSFKEIRSNNEKYPHIKVIPVRYWRNGLFYKGLASQYRRPLAWLELLSYIVNTFRKIRLIEYDILDAHWWFPNGIIAYILSKYTGKPYIITAYAAEITVAQRKLWLKPLANFILRRAKRIICISRFTQSQVVALIKDSVPTIISPMPYDDGVFHVDSKHTITPLLVLAYGNMIKRKGFRFLIEAAQYLPEYKIEIHGVGIEKENLLQSAKSYPNVKVFGRLKDSKAVADKLKSAHVFVMPSITDKQGATEGLGVVILEAMACGTPVVVTDAGGTQQIVKNGWNGEVVPQQNALALAEAIKKITRNEAVSKEYRENSFSTVKEFTKKATASKHSSALRD